MIRSLIFDMDGTLFQTDIFGYLRKNEKWSGEKHN
ncbi:beta-phosphoglucomutase-like phosphatase (HAD superfamily) [Lederbergia wuyishanensis]|uniref:Beta-phosphoglucomutase-like phosphatase (HAD superfamily) n=1 Tax=Lederbergia wuyishanensis TaxID=1347903 RepID=A0ABU0D294_9BACI|nr:beta-phosphoglucomutase-like phosphatase (HAD superfamily) [Lederbergia wuyishanensis]